MQAHGDFRQLKLAVKLMEFGYSPNKVLLDLQQDDTHFDFRQIAILDFQGKAAVHTGPHTRAWSGEIVGPQHVVTGNVLASDGVLQAMSRAFLDSGHAELEDRLLLAVEAGRDAGGQPEGQTSCALTVYERHAFPIVNLRVDVAWEPVGEMRKIFNWFKPLIPYYIARTLDPTSVNPKKAFLEERGLPINPFAS